MKAVEKIRSHFREHKELYIGIGIGLATTVLAVITWCIVKEEASESRGESDSFPRGGSEDPAPSFLNGWTLGDSATVENNISLSIHNKQRGNSGYLTKSLDTGEIFATQKAAAEAFNIPENVLSGHLNGKFNDVDGYKFERLGVLS